MHTIPPVLQTRLDSGVTTLCRCWVIKRADGVTQGFTDHDEDIVLDAIICRAGGGLTGSEVTQKLGLAVNSSELSGALAGNSLNEADLAAGRYDAATIEIWLVDWSEPALRVLLAKGTLGEVRREGQAFTAEVRGLSERLTRKAAGSIPQRALPISATAAAGSISRTRLSVAPAPSFRPRRHRPSPRADSTVSKTAGSPPEN